VIYLRDVTAEELLVAVSYVRSVPRCYKQDKSPDSKDVNTEAEDATVLEAITRRQPVKIQWTEKTPYVL
jgi:hypothetical protein